MSSVLYVLSAPYRTAGPSALKKQPTFYTRVGHSDSIIIVPFIAFALHPSKIALFIQFDRDTTGFDSKHIDRVMTR